MNPKIFSIIMCVVFALITMLAVIAKGGFDSETNNTNNEKKHKNA